MVSTKFWKKRLKTTQLLHTRLALDHRGIPLNFLPSEYIKGPVAGHPGILPNPEEQLHMTVNLIFPCAADQVTFSFFMVYVDATVYWSV